MNSNAGQHEHLLPQAAVFVQALFFVGAQAVQPFEQFELLDLGEHGRIAGNRVVVGERDDVQAARLGLLQNVEVRDALLLKINGGGGVQVQVHSPPLSLCVFGFSLGCQISPLVGSPIVVWSDSQNSAY